MGCPRPRKLLVAVVGAAALVAAGCGGGASRPVARPVSARATLAAAVSQTAAVSSFRFDGTFTLPGGGPGARGRSSGAVDVVHRRSRIDTTAGGLTPGTTMTVSVIEIGQDAWVKGLPLPGSSAATAWLHLPFPAGGGSPAVDPLSPDQLFRQLEAHLGSVEIVGHETLGGVATTHYRAHRTGAPPGTGAPGRGAGVPGVGVPTTVDVWVDRSGLVRKLVGSFAIASPAGSPLSLPGGTATIAITFSGFGAPVDIQPPPASQVSELPLGSIGLPGEPGTPGGGPSTLTSPGTGTSPTGGSPGRTVSGR